MLIRITSLILLILCFIKTAVSQYDASNESFSYIREFPPDPFYPNGVGKMLKTPMDSLPNNAVPTVKCVDPLPIGAFPLPRCISNEFAYNLGPSINSNNLKRQSELRSRRRTNHMATWFGQYISFDITVSLTTIPSNPIYIPADDATFNPPSSIPGELSAKGVTSLPFNLSEVLPGTSDPLNSVRNGVSLVSPLLDLDMVYGAYSAPDGTFNTIRNGTSCYLLTADNGKYPPKDDSGNYIKSASTSSRSWTLFTMAINTVWIREHNRKCKELFDTHGNSWTDQRYFEEARRWNIALYQKTVSEEYLGTILGRPLPAYEGYKPDVYPGIDTFFATVSFRYGHSELR
ncbi:heme peroxidase [Rhizophagus diaphanus]|nr:heme peroxidase [Rhizophagus diaphanus] [Rhizophagus sp. MUCL 43196]